MSAEVAEFGDGLVHFGFAPEAAGEDPAALLDREGLVVAVAGPGPTA